MLQKMKEEQEEEKEKKTVHYDGEDYDEEDLNLCDEGECGKVAMIVEGHSGPIGYGSDSHYYCKSHSSYKLKSGGVYQSPL